MESKHPKVDEHWSVAFEISDYDRFYKQFVPELFLNPSAHKDIHGHIKVIQSLLDLSFYQYEFFDVAMTQAMLTLEMALYLRYNEVTGEHWPKSKTLYGLLRWFRDNQYFETSSGEFLKHIEWIRNYKAHPKMHSFGGPSGKHHIIHAVGMINDLYEDRELRRQRREVVKQIHAFFRKVCDNGGIIQWADGRRELIYFIEVIFYNNKCSPRRTTVQYRPVFVLPKYRRGDGCLVGAPFELVCTLSEIGKRKISGYVIGTKEQFIIELIPGTEEDSAFKQWQILYKAYSAITLHELSIRSGFSSNGMELMFDFYKHDHR